MEFSRFLSSLSALATLACSLDAQSISVRDGAGLPVTVRAPATRIASLVASSIDIIASLGAADRVVARTRYDTAAAVARAANVGGGIDPSVEVLISTRPDLFIAWRGQATTPTVNRMRALGVPVYLVETKDTTALFATVRNLGTLLGLTPRAAIAAEQLRQELRAVQLQRRSGPRPRGVYVISQSPVIIASGGSFMAQLLSVAGIDSPFLDLKGEFPTIALEAFLARDPEVLVLPRASDGASRLTELRATAGWRDLRAVKRGAVIEVDGERWGRPTLGVGALVRDLATALQRLPPPAR
jgi:iron complex transport system substrate-binding protein